MTNAAVLLVWAGTLSGCFGSTATHAHSVDVQVIVSTGNGVVYRQTDHAVAFNVSVLLENRGREAIALRECPVGAEKLVDSFWRLVWTDECLLADGPPTIIAPGAQVERSVAVGGFIDGSATPRFSVIDSVGGTYRLRFGLFTVSKSNSIMSPLPYENTASLPFVLRKS